MSAPELIFGKYEVLRRLAVGGMGEIFLARQRGTAGFDRLVILKSLLPSLGEDPKAVQSFLDEAKTAASLNHPNIVSIYEVGRWQGSYFIAMEYLRGDSLWALLNWSVARKTRLPIGLVLRIMNDAALGLAFAHASRDLEGRALAVVHRDVSPQNIMVTMEGVTKVVDFGIAIAANRDSRTATGVLKGKLRYMPPEQLRGGTVDARSDQFALGVVFWELLTSRRLFAKGEDQVATIASILQSEIPPPSRLRAEVPTDVDRVVMRMLERSPAARYGDCHSVVADLEALLRRPELATSPVELGRFVANALGDKINAKTAELPTGEDFLISFSAPTKSDAPDSPPLTEARPPTPSRPSPPRARASESPRGAPTAPVLNFQSPVSSTFPVPAGTSSNARRWIALGIVASAFLASVLVIVVTQNDQERLASAALITAPPPPAPTSSVAARPPPLPARPPPPSPTLGRLTVRSIPSGAEVYVDLVRSGVTPVRLNDLPPKMYSIEVRKAGFQVIIQPIDLGAAEERVLSLELEPEPQKREPERKDRAVRPKPVVDGRGFLTVDTVPWTQVYLDGRSIGSTPIYKEPLPAGSHVLRFVNPQAAKPIDEERQIQVTADETAKLRFKF